MFKVLFTTVLHGLSCFASSDDFFETKKPTASKTDTTEVLGNWTATFQTEVGAVVHTPSYIQCGFITTGNCLDMQTKSINGFPLTNGRLTLYQNSTKEQFIQALKDFGIYKK
ncbi:MAG TPA: hypothetical protein VI959_01265 [Alphaproteobacteria bacterium]|nr:hypothetical protein [Alphaproteobacteria bacterium]